MVGPKTTIGRNFKSIILVANLLPSATITLVSGPDFDQLVGIGKFLPKS